MTSFCRRRLLKTSLTIKNLRHFPILNWDFALYITVGGRSAHRILHPEIMSRKTTRKTRLGMVRHSRRRNPQLTEKSIFCPKYCILYHDKSVALLLLWRGEEGADTRQEVSHLATIKKRTNIEEEKAQCRLHCVVLFIEHALCSV